MQTMSQINLEAYNAYKSLKSGRFFEMYHDTMLELLEQISYLEDDVEGDMKLALEYLEQCKAIAKAQQILIKANLK